MFKKGTSKSKCQITETTLPSKSSSTFEIMSKEKILNELHSLYVDPKDGLLAIGKKLGLHLFVPRRKVNVMLIGNHSSGKSSFINWYIDAKVQKTGVAIETQGFTMVTAGKSRETLTGKASIRLYPQLKPLETIDGVLQYLSTELTPSRSRRFNLVTFIDTPGLADGKLHYPYDIEKAILWFGDTADLIFVFFDPIGQALCKRTLNLVEKLNQLYPERIRFFLSKADEAGLESDRQKVMMQIVQELCKRKGLNQCGFEMSTIFIPNHTDLRMREQMCANQIEETCDEIEKTIALTIQNTFNTIETDIEQLEELARSKLEYNNSNFKHNFKNGLKLLIVLLLCVQFPISIMLNANNTTVASSASSSSDTPKFILWDLQPDALSNWFEYFPLLMLDFVQRAVLMYMFGISRVLLFFIPAKYALLYSSLFAVPILFVSRFFIHFQATLSIRQMADMRRIVSTLRDVHRRRREELFSCYLSQMVHEVDM